MQTHRLSSALVLAVAALAAAPSFARAQWPASSALSVLPAPPSEPSDELAAYLFRIEMVADQPPPVHPSTYPGGGEAWVDEVLMPWISGLGVRTGWLREEAPHGLRGPEIIVAEGAEAFLRERIAEWLEAAAQMISMPGRWDAQVTALRTSAMERWTRIAAATDPAPQARAWVAFADARLVALRALMPPTAEVAFRAELR